jgi:hypothetical protein
MSTVSILENQDGSGGEVTFWLSTWMDVVIGLPSLPPVGTYSLQDVGASLSCTVLADADAVTYDADAAACSDLLAGIDAGVGVRDAGVGEAGAPDCPTSVTGSLVVTKNSVGSCQLGPHVVSPPTTYCATDFEATLTFETEPSSPYQFFGSVTVEYTQSVTPVYSSCSS